MHSRKYFCGSVRDRHTPLLRMRSRGNHVDLHSAYLVSVHDYRKADIIIYTACWMIFSLFFAIMLVEQLLRSIQTTIMMAKKLSLESPVLTKN